MGMKTRRDPEKEAFWRLVREEHQNSGLTVREFCRKEGLSEPSFHSWKRVLAERDRESTTPPVTGSRGGATRADQNKRRVPGKGKKQPAAAANSFVPVEIVASPIAASPELTIRTPTGFTIGLPSTVDVARLGQVLEILAMQPACSKSNGEWGES